MAGGRPAALRPCPGVPCAGIVFVFTLFGFERWILDCIRDASQDPSGWSAGEVSVDLVARWNGNYQFFVHCGLHNPLLWIGAWRPVLGFVAASKVRERVGVALTPNNTLTHRSF